MPSLAALNIVHVVRQYRPAIGGMENFVEQLALQQVSSGHRVTVVTLDRIFDDPKAATLAPSETIGGIAIRRVRYRGSRRYPLAPGVLAAVRTADLIHVHGVDFFADYLAAFAWLHRTPMVLTTHGGFFHTRFAQRLKQLYFRSVTRVSLSQFGAVIACSEEDARQFRQIAKSRLVLIPNPVDIDKFDGLADADCTTLIYFGRLAPNKGLDRLVAWFGGLASGDAGWRLIIAGKPMGTTIAELRAQAESQGSASRIEFHDTPTDDALKGLIARSAVYCCASSYEGFGLAAIEGVSAGLYPLLSDIPPFRSSLERLGFGTLVDFNDAAGWPESYRAFEISHRAFRRDFGRDEIRRSVEPFAWSGAAPAFDAVYSRVLGRQSRKIGTVEVAVRTTSEATGAILDAAYARQPLMVAFCNAHTVNLASRNAPFRNALEHAVVLNDGVGVDIAGRWLFRSRFPANLNGTDFVPQIIASADRPLRIFLLGGHPGVAEAAARRIVANQPCVEVVGTMHGFFDDAESRAIVERIRRSGANIVLAAMGQPRQELWAAQHFRELGGPVLCVGALFDFLAQRVPRAPAAMRRARLEWAFRLINEPRRLWRRYLLGNAAFLMRIVRQRLVGTRL